MSLHADSDDEANMPEAARGGGGGRGGGEDAEAAAGPPALAAAAPAAAAAALPCGLASLAGPVSGPPRPTRMIKDTDTRNSA